MATGPRVQTRSGFLIGKSRQFVRGSFSAVNPYEFHESARAKITEAPTGSTYLRTELPALSFPRKREFPSRRPYTVVRIRDWEALTHDWPTSG